MKLFHLDFGFGSVLLLIILAILAAFTQSGCAQDRAVEGVGRIVGTVSTALVEKSHITDSRLAAKGEIHDPEYEVDGFYVTGFVAKIHTRGIDISASAEGSGSGPDITLTPEQQAALAARGLDRDAIDRLIDAAIAKATATSQSAHP